jgi:hypothetical protein
MAVPESIGYTDLLLYLLCGINLNETVCCQIFVLAGLCYIVICGIIHVVVVLCRYTVLF